MPEKVRAKTAPPTDEEVALALSILRRKGGRAKSERKTEACRRNGRLGGRTRIEPVRIIVRGETFEFPSVGEAKEFLEPGQTYTRGDDGVRVYNYDDEKEEGETA
jgi:hypothetical protein